METKTSIVKLDKLLVLQVVCVFCTYHLESFGTNMGLKEFEINVTCNLVKALKGNIQVKRSFERTVVSTYSANSILF